MLRVLIADDQIPDDDVPDGDVLTWAQQQYPDFGRGFQEACVVMRRAVNTLRDGCSVTVARRFADALELIRRETFDLAIIDLGWAGDRSVPNERTAGWKLVDVIKAEDRKHPERPPTDQIIYSSRFEVQPDLGQEAANKGILPFYKPYGERHSLPLGNEPEGKISRKDRIRIASESLRAVVKFIEHLRTREIQRLLQAANERLGRAEKDHHQWHVLTLVMVAAGVLIVLAGVIALLFFSVPQGAVTAASGVVVSLIPKLIYGRLDKAYSGIKDAHQDLQAALAKARLL
jgi:CheY-like chemotaxis protein